MSQTVQVGSVFAEAWGYDQTNYDYWQVVRATGRTVWVRHIASRVDEYGGPYGNKVTPKADAFTWPDQPWQTTRAGRPDSTGTIRKTLKAGSGGGPYLRMTSYSGARLWDGAPDRETDPIYGH